MSYTVKQLAAIAGVTIRTLHFYDEIGLLKPARHAANSYRFYEEAQLLTLQQILFYRELGFELKQIKQILTSEDFEQLAALQSHRQVLVATADRTQSLIETIDKTIDHLKGTRTMTPAEMFSGFTVGMGESRFDDHNRVGGQANDCKVSGADTAGAMCVYEFTGTQGGPKHLHREVQEWIYVVDGTISIQLGDRLLHLQTGDSVYIPSGVPHVWACDAEQPAKIVNVYQPAGKIEEFFRAIAKHNEQAPLHVALSVKEMQQFFADHGLELLGPPLLGQWQVNATGHAVRSS